MKGSVKNKQQLASYLAFGCGDSGCYAGLRVRLMQLLTTFLCWSRCLYAVRSEFGARAFARQARVGGSLAFQVAASPLSDPLLQDGCGGGVHVAMAVVAATTTYYPAFCSMHTVLKY
jgi:hypothetical protein